jgi:hypothetical protein
MSALTAILLSWFVGVTGAPIETLCGPNGALDTESCPAGAPPPPEASSGQSSASPSPGTKPGDAGNKPSNRIYNGI